MTERARRCETCKGKGTRRLPAGRYEFGDQYYETFICADCGGDRVLPADGEKDPIR